jgi:hypothetical protein
MAEVFQHLATHHRIERFVRVGDGINLDVAQPERNPLGTVCIGMDGRLILDVERMTFMAKLRQQRQEKAVPRPYIQHSMAVSQCHGDFSKSVDAPFEHILDLGITPSEKSTFITQLHRKAQHISFVLGAEMRTVQA